MDDRRSADFHADMHESFGGSMNRYIVAAVLAATIAGATEASGQGKSAAPAKKRANAVAPANRASAANDAESNQGLGRGVMLGISAIAAPGLTIKGPDIEGEVSTKFGAGLGLQLGYGFSQRFMAFATLDLAKQDSGMDGVDGDFGLVTFEVGGRMALPLQGTRVTPYVLAAVGARSLGARVEEAGDESDVSLSGGTFDVGAGLQLPLTRSLALDSEVRLGVGKFGKFKQDDDTEDIDVDNTMSPRVRVGLSWYPRAR
jgi:hypothetical protein